MSDGLYQRYRPTKLDDVVGQPQAVETIRGFKKIPNAVLLHGGSGCGKTTLARIMSSILKCPPHKQNMDYQEVDCAAVGKPLEYIRELISNSSSAPSGGRDGSRVWVLDECQSFSKAGFAQQAMLRLLESGPDHAYYFLCTTDPKKLLPTIRNRCTQIELKPVADAELTKLIKRVAETENVKPALDAKLVTKIVEVASGSPRIALVELEKVIGLTDPAARMRAVGQIGIDIDAFEIVKAIIPFKGKPEWAMVVEIVERIKNEDPESIRMLILSVAKNGLLKETDPLKATKYYKLIRCLDTPCYDKVSGWAYLVAGFFQVCFGGQ